MMAKGVPYSSEPHYVKHGVLDVSWDSPSPFKEGIVKAAVSPLFGKEGLGEI
jgi:hypothetical protein